MAKSASVTQSESFRIVFQEHNWINFSLSSLLRSTDNNECSLRNGHGPCQDQCHNTEGSYRCSCDGMAGTQLAADGHSCEDIDECRLDNGGCSHSCLNTLGTAFCACPEGYMLGDDWKTCEGTGAISSSRICTHNYLSIIALSFVVTLRIRRMYCVTTGSDNHLSSIPLKVEEDAKI